MFLGLNVTGRFGDIDYPEYPTFFAYRRPCPILSNWPLVERGNIIRGTPSCRPTVNPCSAEIFLYTPTDQRVLST